MKDKLIEESLEDVDVSFEMERKSEKGIAKNIISDDDDESDESYESYVPDSLRDFLKAADAQLEADLSFLSPAAAAAPTTTLYDKDVLTDTQDDDDDVDEGTNILASDLEKEMAKARQKDLERQQAMKQEALDRQERERKQVDQNELEKQQQKQKRIEESAKLQAQTALMDEDDDDMDDDDMEDANVTSPLLDIVHPAADVTESHVKRIAMEGADIVEPEPLQPLVESTTTGHLPSPTINSDMAALANGTTSFSPTPPRAKVGRKLEMQLDAEAHRASLSPGQLRLEGQEDDNDDNNNNDNKNNNTSMESRKSTLEEKQKSMQEKQARLKELQSRSVERKKRLEVLDDREAERNSVEVVLKDTVVQQPTPAAAAAADKAAEVPKKSLTGPVKSLPPHMQRNAQKWSFKPRDAPSPPRPKEIITHSLFSPDGRPVSPLGNEQPAVSPLASPNTKQTSYQRAPVRRYQPTQTSPSKRRPLTKPTNHTFSFMKPTAASNALVGKPEETRKKVNPEEERRKARERVRQRMATQRRTTKSSNLASPPVNTAAAERARARKERVQKMEEERKAKIKARIAEKEERLKKFEEAKKKEEAARKRQKKATPQNKPPSVARPSSRPLTIPVAPKFSIDRRLAQKETASAKKTTVSLAASSQNFAKGLRSSAPPPRHATPEPRRLTIPMAPKFSIAGTPINSPPRRKGRDIADDVSWSSSLRDVSAITSPVSKAANSIRTGNNLTIPITPQFHPIRKRPLPKSTAEREKEEMEQAKEHAFKARMERNKQLLAVARAKPKNPPPKRTLTQPTPFRFSTLNRRGVLDYEEVAPSLIQTKPKPSVPSSKKPVKKMPSQPRKLTTPEPFTFRSASRNRSTYTKSESESNSSYTFKPKPMPDFKKAHRKSYGKRIPSPRALTTPEPFHFRSETISRRSTPKSEEDTSSYKPFKPRPMPDFKKAHQNSVETKRLKSPPTRPLTIPQPFKFRETSTRRRVETKEERETYKPFKPRPMPNFEKVSPQTQREIDRQKAKKTRNKKPTGASGLLFHHRARQQEPPKYELGHMPNFIPEVIVTRTPIKESGFEIQPKSENDKFDDDDKSIELEANTDDELEEEDIFADFDKFHDSRLKLDKIGSSSNLLSSSNLGSSSNLRHTPSPRRSSISPRKEEKESSHVFKPRPSPRNMLDEPKIPVRMRDPKKLRHTPSPRKIKEETEEPFVFKPRPAPKGMLDDPKIPVRMRDPKKLRSPDSVKRPNSPDEPTPIRRTNASSPIRKLESPDRFYDASPIRKPSSPDRFYDASPSRPVASPPRIHRDAPSNNSSITTRNSNSTGTGNVMEDAKARLRERLSQRQSNSAAVKAATPDRSKSKPKSTEPMAFSTLRVKSLLDSNTNARKEQEQLRKESSFENTPRKSNREVPKSIDLPSGEKAIKPKTFPNIPNYTVPEGSPAESSGFHTANDGSDAKEAALLKEAKLALALGIPDGDESSSILQLARDVQKAAEDELSFYGSVDTRDHWSSSLADGKPHSLLG